MKLRIMIAIAVPMFLLPELAFGCGIGWTLINAKIRHDFPTMPRISTSDLAAWLNDSSRPAPLLLDVRTQAEFDVSHLRGAQHVAPDAPAAIVHWAKDQPIVTYCSVGYRSGVFAEKLRASGFSEVVNLDGSIFRWANERRPVVREDRIVETVHPYNPMWGSLLQKKYRADVASISRKP